MEQLKNKVAFITGGAGGIGLALAKIFAAEGMRIVLADIDTEELQHAAAQFDAVNCLSITLDVTNRASWRNAREAVTQRFGAVDVLCNNAGIGPDRKAFTDMPPANFDRMIATNLTSVFNGISTFGAHMRERQAGHIVNTSSTAGLVATANLGAYTAAKFAVVGMSEVLREEMAPHNVGVTVFCPGLTYSRLTASAVDRKQIPANKVMDTMTAAQFVLNAIRNNDLYAFSHSSYRDEVAARVMRMLDAFAHAV